MVPGAVFLVGGAVRDAHLGHQVADRDWVVVGATPQAMLGAGFKQVGRDFPVFLHPETGEEYALARTERKSGRGYTGFTVYAAADVTLEEDLARRDLTMNAMARAADGSLVDPYGGARDLADKVLRHVRSESFVEDPVRVLRLARFAARYSDFTVASETLSLVRCMVAAGELEHLVVERVWQEFAKGLMEARPSRMFEVLHETGALAVLMPELDALWGVPQPAAHHPEVDTGRHVMLALDESARRGASLDVRFAVLVHDLGKGATPQEAWPAHHDHDARGLALVDAVSRRLKVPAEARELARLVTGEHVRVHLACELTASSLLKLLMRVDAFRRPARVEALLLANESDARGRLGFENRDYPQADHLRRAFEAARSVKAGDVAAATTKPELIPQRVYDARLRAIKAALRAAA